MRIYRGLFLAHLLALVFGLGGLLIALPHPELWQGSPAAARVFDFGLRYAGSLHMLLGAAAVLAFGLVTVGSRRTLIFALAAAGLSLLFESVGTRTGWPFGNYAYTDFLGYKLGGRVPFTIPLSWFYMGFTSYLIACLMLRTRAHKRGNWMVVLLGAWLLTAWDLTLDPAMANHSMPIHFWTWFESGPYFGMPVKNLAGWTLTAIAFMAVSRLLWKENLDARRIPAWFPAGMYLANSGFAVALSLGAGLWQPVVIGSILAAVPVLLFLRPAGRQTSATPVALGQPE